VLCPVVFCFLFCSLCLLALLPWEFLLFFHCSFVLVVTCIGTSCTGSVLIKFAVIKKKKIIFS
jgi:hypothetical protein